MDSFLTESTSYGGMGVNMFVRDNFLDDGGKLVLDPSWFFDSGVVFEGHDMLTQTTLSVKFIRLEGHDSFEEMDLLDAIGRQTLRNGLRLGHLFARLEMEASSRSDAIVVAPKLPAVTEEFTVFFGAFGVEVDASVFLGLNAETLGGLELGSLLHSINSPAS